jgi:MFS family permease
MAVSEMMEASDDKALDSMEKGDKGISRPPNQHRDDHHHQKPQHHDIPHAESPIAYLYLTFDSPLPEPPAPADGQRQPAAPPDLRKFTDPKTWGMGIKSVLLTLSCSATFLTAYSAGSYSPPSKLLADDLQTTQTIILLGITTFCAGFGLAPMVLAPVSEIWGRYPVFVVAGFVFVAFEAACALVTDLAGMLIARFFVGAGASVFSSVVGGVLADLWDKEDRNSPMSLFSCGVLAGTGAGPLVAAAFVARVRDATTAWRWTFWHQVITDGLLLVAFILFFRETRASVLLSRKAARLNKWYEELEKAGIYGVWVRDADLQLRLPRLSTSSSSSNSQDHNDGGEAAAMSTSLTLRRIRWKVQADEERASLATMMTTSIVRPFHLLFTEPVVFFFSLWAAFAWGILYLAFAVVPYLHAGDYNAASRTYIAMIVGSLVATGVSIWQERLLHHPQWRVETVSPHTDSQIWAFLRRRFPAESPEARLYFAGVLSFLLPAGLFGAFMASATRQATSGDVGGGDHGTALAIGFGFATWGIYVVYLAAFNYLADSYHIYASSALAANSFCRNVIGGCFPLVTAVMFDNMGIKPAGGLLAGLATVLTVIPWVLIFNGEKIRARSRMAIVSPSTTPVFFFLLICMTDLRLQLLQK